MKKILSVIIALLIAVSSMTIPSYASSKYWLNTNSFTASELTDSVVKGYLGKTKDAAFKDLKTRDISAVDESYDRLDIYVVGTIHAYTLILDENDKVVGAVIRKTFWSDPTEQQKHDAFIKKVNATLAAMKKEKGFQHNTSVEDGSTSTYATCTLKNGQFMELIMNYEIDYEFNVTTDVYISYFLSADYVPQG